MPESHTLSHLITFVLQGIPITLARLLLHTGGGSTPSLGRREELII